MGWKPIEFLTISLFATEPLFSLKNSFSPVFPRRTYHLSILHLTPSQWNQSALPRRGSVLLKKLLKADIGVTHGVTQSWHSLWHIGVTSTVVPPSRGWVESWKMAVFDCGNKEIIWRRKPHRLWQVAYHALSSLLLALYPCLSRCLSTFSDESITLRSLLHPSNALLTVSTSEQNSALTSLHHLIHRRIFYDHLMNDWRFKL